MTLAGARVYYAMSQDGLFFKSVGKLHPRYKTPVAGLLVQGAWTHVLCVSGSYSQLLDYIIFAELVFYILTIAGLFVLRFKRPDAPRPYKALGYPVLPALYIVMAAWICIVLLRYKPQYTWPGLVLVLLGIPVYLFWSRRVAVRGLSHITLIDLLGGSTPHPCPGCFVSNPCRCSRRRLVSRGNTHSSAHWAQ